MESLPTGQAGKKVTSYLLYALGEIVLVVIGIMIAVSINNWNTTQINRDRMKTAVEFMLTDLKKDSIARQAAMDFTIPQNREINKWLERINSDDATLDTIIHIMRYEFIGTWINHFSSNTTSYDNMKSSGILDMLPDSIRISIDNYYTSMGRTIEIMNIYNVQYRDPLEEYNKTYSIFINIDNVIDEAIWENLKPAHFLPKARWLVFTKSILWNQYEKFCREDQEKLIQLQGHLHHFLNNVN